MSWLVTLAGGVFASPPAMARALNRQDGDVIELRALHTMDELRPVVDLLTEVWGRNADGVPMPGETLRSLVHADGLVSAAFLEGALVGAAALGRARPGHCYGYIAAARPGLADRGIGFALKQHQRRWALAAGLHTMEWTFDPLVRRNARFNLTKLGAEAGEYEEGFYGRMDDEQNAGDVGDRLVACWRLDSERATQAADGRPALTPLPSDRAEVLLRRDGEPVLLADQRHRWLRAPADIVQLRRRDPATAAGWRPAMRAAFQRCFADGYRAVGVSGDYYVLTELDQN